MAISKLYTIKPSRDCLWWLEFTVDINSLVEIAMPRNGRGNKEVLCHRENP